MVDLGIQVEDPGSDVDLLRDGTEVRDEHLARREMGVLFEKVVLGQPRVLESVAIGLLDQLDLSLENARVLGVLKAAGDETSTIY